MQIFISRNNQRYGPYTIDDIQAYLLSGHLSGGDMAWYQGAPNWIPLSQVPGIQLPGHRTPPPPSIVSPPPASLPPANNSGRGPSPVVASSGSGCLFGALYVFLLVVVLAILGQFVDTHRNQIPARAFIHELFMWLSVISFLCFLLGLVSPTIFSTLLKHKATRKYISYASGTALLFCLTIGTSTLSDAEKAEQKKAAAAKTAAKAAKREAEIKQARAREQAAAAARAVVPRPVQPDPPAAASADSPGDFSDAADEAAKRDLLTTPWVKDVYVSPGHMNIGVIRDEKDWSAPMIGSYSCGVLRKHGSRLGWVRFVDIEAVANQGQSPNQAEISKFSCP